MPNLPVFPPEPPQPIRDAIESVIGVAERIRPGMPLWMRAIIYKQQGTLVSHGTRNLEQAIEDAKIFAEASLGVKILHRTHPYYIETGKEWEVHAYPLDFPFEPSGTPLEDVLRGITVERTLEWEQFYKEPFPVSREEIKKKLGMK